MNKKIFYQLPFLISLLLGLFCFTTNAHGQSTASGIDTAHIIRVVLPDTEDVNPKKHDLVNTQSVRPIKKPNLNLMDLLDFMNKNPPTVQTVKNYVEANSSRHWSILNIGHEILMTWVSNADENITYSPIKKSLILETSYTEIYEGVIQQLNSFGSFQTITTTPKRGIKKTIFKNSNYVIICLKGAEGYMGNDSFTIEISRQLILK